jgi:hypothetical protein
MRTFSEDIKIGYQKIQKGMEPISTDIPLSNEELEGIKSSASTIDKSRK